MQFTKQQQEFIDWIDAVVDAELDLETTIMTDGKNLLRDDKFAMKMRRDFFEWFKKQVK